MRISHALSLTAIACAALVPALLLYAAGTAPTIGAPTLGQRGMQRRRALRRSAAFRLVEPAVRFVGGWLQRALPYRIRKLVEARLTWAGGYLGWNAGEYAAASLLSGATAAVAAAPCIAAADAPWAWLLPALTIGLALPRLHVDGEIARRVKEVRRGLPAAIDLASMCMHAGLDFPGAVRLIVRESPADDALTQELAALLRELDFGHTRAHALRELERRVPSAAVRDFVHAVIQSEEKGHPLASVLETQAGVLRARRTASAEEAAARAGVMMMFPLMLLLTSLLVLLFGALSIDAMSAGAWR